MERFGKTFKIIFKAARKSNETLKINIPIELQSKLEKSFGNPNNSKNYFILDDD